MSDQLLHRHLFKSFLKDLVNSVTVRLNNNAPVSWLISFVPFVCLMLFTVLIEVIGRFLLYVCQTFSTCICCKVLCW